MTSSNNSEQHFSAQTKTIEIMKQIDQSNTSEND
jgi:hypothetical protein